MEKVGFHRKILFTMFLNFSLSPGSNSGDSGFGPTAALVPVKIPNFRADAVLMQSLTDKEIEVVYRFATP